MSEDARPRLVTATTMWVLRVSGSARLLDMLAAGVVVVDVRNGKIGLRLELNPRPLPSEPENED